ncbi:hypothetical protein [Dactylosporangium sp. CS-033363]|uniref:hypothetical protein n=1 Tax=Dactylosporangium sp. CS-033363 TaxID=3239935 RepID=UPI003D90A16B
MTNLRNVSPIMRTALLHANPLGGKLDPGTNGSTASALVRLGLAHRIGSGDYDLSSEGFVVRARLVAILVGDAFAENIRRSAPGTVDIHGNRIRPDAEGFLFVVNRSGLPTRITTCCYATITPKPEGLACRACFNDVAEALGDAPVVGSFDGVFEAHQDADNGPVYAWRHAACGITSTELYGDFCHLQDLAADEHAEHVKTCTAAVRPTEGSCSICRADGQVVAEDGTVPSGDQHMLAVTVGANGLVLMCASGHGCAQDGGHPTYTGVVTLLQQHARMVFLHVSAYNQRDNVFVIVTIPNRQSLAAIWAPGFGGFGEQPTDGWSVWCGEEPDADTAPVHLPADAKPADIVAAALAKLDALGPAFH